MAVEKVGQNKNAYKRVTCRECGSILRYLPTDVEEREHTDYSGVTDNYRSIKCPECGHRVDVR